MDNIANIPKREGLYISLNQSRITSINTIDFQAVIGSASYDCPNRGIHPRGVAAARQNSDAFHDVSPLSKRISYPSGTKNVHAGQKEKPLNGFYFATKVVNSPMLAYF